MQFYVAILAIGPWIAALAYDLILYVCRSVMHTIPFLRGRQGGRNPQPEGPEAVQIVGVGTLPVPVPVPTVLVPEAGGVDTSDSSEKT